MEYDLTTKIKPVIAFKAQAIVSSTTTAGEIIDTKGFEALDVAVASATLTDGTYVVSISGSDDSGMAGSAVITDIIGTLPEFALTEDDAVKHFGSYAKYRYYQISIVSTVVTTGGSLSAIATLGHAHSQPTA